MPDLESRLRSYAEHVELRFPEITFDEITGGLGHATPSHRLPTRRLTTRRGLAIALASGVVVLVLVGAVALFTRGLGTDPAPVVTEPESAPTTSVEPPPEQDIDAPPEQDIVGRQAIDTSLGTWVWTYAGEGFEVGRTLLEGLFDPPVLAPELAEMPLPQIDGMKWRPRLHQAASATSGGITATIVPADGYVDWSLLYQHESGWVEGHFPNWVEGDAVFGRGPPPGRRIETPTTLRIAAMQAFAIDDHTGEHRSVGILATLEVSVVPGDPEAVEFHDQDTGELVLRLEATGPELPAEQLVRAGALDCGSADCPVALWRLYVDGVDGADPGWIDPPWRELSVDRLAIATGSEGFVIAAVVGSPSSPTLHSWVSADGRAWKEFRPPEPIELTADVQVVRLQLIGGGDTLAAFMDVHTWTYGWSLVRTSTDGGEWLPGNPWGFEVEKVASTPHGWVMVGFRPDAGAGPRCVVLVSPDGVTWEQVALPSESRRVDMSQCHLAGDTVVLGTEHILNMSDYAAGRSFESSENWWQGGFEE